MLIRLLGRDKKGGAVDYQLVDILRRLSSCDRDNVISRSWRVSDLDLYSYGDGGFDERALRLMFPELGEHNEATDLVVSGVRLLERSALVHQFESGLFLRLVDPCRPSELCPDYRLCHGPPTIQASNADLEIRCEEGLPYEVVSDDEWLIGCLEEGFAYTETE